MDEINDDNDVPNAHCDEGEVCDFSGGETDEWGNICGDCVTAPGEIGEPGTPVEPAPGEDGPGEGAPGGGDEPATTIPSEPATGGDAPGEGAPGDGGAPGEGAPGDTVWEVVKEYWCSEDKANRMLTTTTKWNSGRQDVVTTVLEVCGEGKYCYEDPDGDASDETFAQCIDDPNAPLQTCSQLGGEICDPLAVVEGELVTELCAIVEPGGYTPVDFTDSSDTQDPAVDGQCCVGANAHCYTEQELDALGEETTTIIAEV